MAHSVASLTGQRIVQMIWATNPSAGSARREFVLPTGDLHLVLRLADLPLEIFDSPDDGPGRSLSTAVVGGARSSYYCRTAEPGCPAVGVLLAPGACRVLTGVPAGSFAERHVALEDIWPSSRVAEMRDRLAAADATARPELMAALLGSMIDDWGPPDPLVAAGARALGRGLSVSEAAAEIGVSRRHFTRRFVEEIGLAPRDWLRTRRFNRLVERLQDSSLSLADVAAASGFADQPHMSREFMQMAGMTAASYRRIAPPKARHVPCGIDMSQGFKTADAATR